jgi:hypothetical protein
MVRHQLTSSHDFLLLDIRKSRPMGKAAIAAPLKHSLVQQTAWRTTPPETKPESKKKGERKEGCP